MLRDARADEGQDALEADICIIGGGAAGITIAREFLNTPYKIVLLESGGKELEAETQDLYRGKNIGRPYYDLDICRLRFFGGTTNHWAGWCRPFSPTDFKKRSWVPDSGWPFDYHYLEPFYRRAQTVLQMGPYGYHADRLATSFPGIAGFQFDETRIRAECYQFSPPTRFGEVYGPELFKHPNVSVLFNANVVEIQGSETRAGIESVRYKTLNGRDGRVTARIFILATGGIENARLLLTSDIGNQNDLVGRYFMEHPEPVGGSFLVIDQNDDRWIPFAHQHPQRHIATRPLGCIAIAEELQRREEIINTRIGFTYMPPVYSEGFAAARHLLGRDESGDRSPRKLASDIWNVVADLDGFAEQTAQEIKEGATVLQMLEVEVYGQQAPNPDSRVTLDDERDALGMPRVRMHWSLTDFDRRSVDRTLRIVAQEFGRLGLGRMHLDFKEWEPDFYYGNHHMGTTRMHDDPRKGVVDRNCRVHGVGNLYVAGSSTFPTSGNAPPTMTIVAMALRLADTIKAELSA